MSATRPRAGLARRLWAETKGYRGHLVGIFGLSVLATPLALLTPVPLKVAVDSVVGSKPLPDFLDALLPGFATTSEGALLLSAVALFVLIGLLQQLQVLAELLLSTYTGEQLVLGFRTRLFNHVQRLSLSYHDRRGATDSTFRIEYDAPAIQHIAVDGVIPIVTAALTLVAMVWVTALIDWQLALVALAICPFLFVVIRVFSPRLRRGWRDAKRHESLAMSVVQEALAGLRVVKAFGQEGREGDRFLRRSSAGMRARIRLTASEGLFGLLVGLATALGTGSVLYIGIRHVRSGEITLGELLIVMSYLVQLYEPLRTMSTKFGDLQNSVVGLERAFAVLDEAPDVPERSDARPIARTAGAVTFREVSFGYDPDQLVLRDVSFDVEPGTCVGIAGTTGAGKTTLVSLLMRFYDPTSGQILLDGVDLRDYRVVDLREQFAIVLQEPVLFSTSIGENIAYARPGASRADVVHAAEAANAHEFITQLPDGYDTAVGERGMRLSGGERQRISLARAFLKDAPILILDEPTSSVDLRTEAAIMEAMGRLIEGRTTFMIAHRLSTLEVSDTRLQIEEGRLVESGPAAAANGKASDGRRRGMLGWIGGFRDLAGGAGPGDAARKGGPRRR